MESVQANDEYAEIGFLNAVQLDPEEAEDPDRFEHEIIDFAYENGCTQQGDLDTMILLEINE
ncbi:hypothetical protein C0584_01935 [Candidatus Parcubacteria bacterium]|nr:MAG: hypothetical protein C0584_01935 [Candidatus Parcubacteria bacterium]